MHRHLYTHTQYLRSVGALSNGLLLFPSQPGAICIVPDLLFCVGPDGFPDLIPHFSFLVRVSLATHSPTFFYIFPSSALQRLSIFFIFLLKQLLQPVLPIVRSYSFLVLFSRFPFSGYYNHSGSPKIHIALRHGSKLVSVSSHCLLSDLLVPTRHSS